MLAGDGAAASSAALSVPLTPAGSVAKFMGRRRDRARRLASRVRTSPGPVSRGEDVQGDHQVTGLRCGLLPTERHSGPASALHTEVVVLGLIL